MMNKRNFFILASYVFIAVTRILITEINFMDISQLVILEMNKKYMYVPFFKTKLFSTKLEEEKNPTC